MQMPWVRRRCVRSVRLGARGRAGCRSVEATRPGSVRMLGATVARGRAAAELAVEAPAGRSFLSVGGSLVDILFMELSEKGAR